MWCLCFCFCFCFSFSSGSGSSAGSKSSCTLLYSLNSFYYDQFHCKPTQPYPLNPTPSILPLNPTPSTLPSPPFPPSLNPTRKSPKAHYSTSPYPSTAPSLYLSVHLIHLFRPHCKSFQRKTRFIPNEILTYLYHIITLHTIALKTHYFSITIIIIRQV